MDHVLGDISVRVFVRDLEEAQQFYEERLGLIVKFKQPGVPVTTYEAGNAVLVVEAVDETDEEGVSYVGRFTGVTFATKSCQDAYAELTACGIEFLGSPEKQYWGGIMAHFYDSSRNVFTILESPAAPE
jgi:predicted enzyme related to lactoylglutathione lyase